MEYVIDIDIIGEILIPLENIFGENTKTFENLNSVLDKNFNDFRSIIFQGEVLRFFLAMKIDSPNNIENLLEEFYFKLELDTSCDVDEINNIRGNEIENDFGFSNDINNENPNFYDFKETKYSDLFAVHRNTTFTSDDTTNNFNFVKDNNLPSEEKSNDAFKNFNYDFVSRKFFMKEKKIVVFEILKHISKILIFLSFLFLFIHYETK